MVKTWASVPEAISPDLISPHKSPSHTPTGTSTNAQKLTALETEIKNLGAPSTGGITYKGIMVARIGAAVGADITTVEEYAVPPTGTELAGSLEYVAVKQTAMANTLGSSAATGTTDVVTIPTDMVQEQVQVTNINVQTAPEAEEEIVRRRKLLREVVLSVKKKKENSGLRGSKTLRRILHEEFSRVLSTLSPIPANVTVSYSIGLRQSSGETADTLAGKVQNTVKKPVALDEFVKTSRVEFGKKTNSNLIPASIPVQSARIAGVQLNSYADVFANSWSNPPLDFSNTARQVHPGNGNEFKTLITIELKGGLDASMGFVNIDPNANDEQGLWCGKRPTLSGARYEGLWCGKRPTLSGERYGFVAGSVRSV